MLVLPGGHLQHRRRVVVYWLRCGHFQSPQRQHIQLRVPVVSGGLVSDEHGVFLLLPLRRGHGIRCGVWRVLPSGLLAQLYNIVRRLLSGHVLPRRCRLLFTLPHGLLQCCEFHFLCLHCDLLPCRHLCGRPCLLFCVRGGHVQHGRRVIVY